MIARQLSIGNFVTNLRKWVAGLAVVTPCLWPPAFAVDVKRSSGTVTACSDFGNGCIKARVRETRLGKQYLNSGGAWIWCGYSCAETLRCNTVDFWENQDGLTAPGEGRLWLRLTQ
jgi:hypothetical protein